jgi:hypothetical protein
MDTSEGDLKLFFSDSAMNFEWNGENDETCVLADVLLRDPMLARFCDQRARAAVRAASPRS